MAQWADHKLMIRIIEQDWTLVTHNAKHFRPNPGSDSLAPCYRGQPLHAGLVCLNLPVGATRDVQLRYFGEALIHIGCPGDLICRVLEVYPKKDEFEGVDLREYDFP